MSRGRPAPGRHPDLVERARRTLVGFVQIAPSLGKTLLGPRIDQVINSTRTAATTTVVWASPAFSHSQAQSW